MGRIVLVVSLLLVFAACAHADDKRKWTHTDTVLQIAYYTLHAADWLQTRYIAKHPDRYYECNPIIGKHPGVGKVNTYFAVSAGINTVIPYLLPRPYRTIWQGGIIAVEVGCVASNARVGIKLQF